MNPSTPTIDQKGTAMGFLLSSVVGGGVHHDFLVKN